jgi:hypothetical protein
MSFDNSRFTFDPWKNYLGVVMQQGRVQLDSDWNEWVAELLRRVQAGTLDILGLSGVPTSTPNAFKITAGQQTSNNTTTNQISIGTGRIYVDGVLAENHGTKGSVQWDAALAEWSPTPQVPIDYTQQPYLPGAALPGAGATAPNGPFLVYLDVWRRDIDYVAAPDLVESAVGVDTTGRYQTIWQVKVANVSSGVYCSTADPAVSSIPANPAVTDWQSMFQVSASQLTVSGGSPAASPNPCTLSPASGYTGMENQLYRVQIHQGGAGSANPPTAASTATFKWSRENASVTTGVSAIGSVTNSIGNPASQLTVQSMGRDQVLGFNPGDWIEVIDDNLDLNGIPGELHQIDSINAAAKIITLDAVVSSTNFPVNSTNQTTASRHTRIRRWDQSGTIYLSDGVTPWADLNAVGNTGIPIPPLGTTLLLENGITVSFNLANSAGVFQSGDYWVFAARTADGSVESLNQASPAGIHHHYCRLAMVDFTATPPTVSDCRRLFPSLANPALHITNAYVGGTKLLNNSLVTIQNLFSGISVVCDGAIDPTILSQPGVSWSSTVNYTPGQVVISGGNYYICSTANLNQTPPNATYWNPVQFNSPICYVTVDIPSPTAGEGFSSVHLSSAVSVSGNTINWTPSTAAQTVLQTQVTLTGQPVLARFTLKGNFVWAQGNPSVYLNGACNPLSPGPGLQLPSGDGRASGNFEMWFWLTSQPVVTLTPGSLNFPTPQLVGSPSASQSITLSNNSTKNTLTVSSITVTGANSGDFVETSTCSSATPIPAGGSCTITVTFTPAAVGTRTAQLNITESADTAPLVVTLSGTAIAPEVSAAPTSLSFNPQIVGTKSAAQVITLTNPGTSQLTITGITLGGDAADFSETSTCLPASGSGTLQPGATCTISVQFTPTAANARTATLMIAHNAAGSPLTIPLNGNGIAGVPAVTPSPASLGFGSVVVGSSSSRSVTLTNSGTGQLAITQVQVTGTNASSFSASSGCGSGLAPAATCSISVTFKPAAAAALSAQLVISHNAAGSPLTIPLTGTGTNPKTIILDKLKDTKLLDKTVDVTKTPVEEQVASGTVAEQSTTQKSFVAADERPAVGNVTEPEG